MPFKNIAIIPARGGSKRIPGKNIKEFCGKPIISWSIEAALASNFFDEVMVSTDDDEIANIAKGLGAKVPFMRSAKNADDFATTFDVLNEVLLEYSKAGKSFTYGCCIYPTAPFVTAKKLTESFQLLTENKFDVVLPVVAYSYPIWRSLKMEDNKIAMWWPENMNKRSQDLPKSYHDAGQFCWFNVGIFLQNQTLFTPNTGAYTLTEMEVQDIDSIEDWKLAEAKFMLQKNTK